MFILTAEYGSGHVIAARGITDALDHFGYRFLSLDVVKAGGVIEKVSSWAFELMMRRGHLAWRMFYYNPIPSSKPARMLYRFVFKDKFMEPLREFEPDVIISTHFLTSLIALIYKTKKPNTGVFTVITDLVAHPLWVWEGTDGYFVGIKDTGNDLKKYGVDEDKIFITGIPLRRDFWKPMDKISARKHLNYPLNDKIILLSAGSYDSVPIETIVRGLKGEDVFLVILAGKRREAYEKYNRLLQEIGLRGIVYPFVDFVPLIMCASDIFITKAGGVSVAESLAVGLPMIFIRSMPGQEEGNAKVIEKYKAGINAQTPENALKHLKSLLKDTNLLKELQENAKAIGKPSSSLDIVNIISNKFGKTL